MADADEIRRRVEKYYDERAGFYIHLLVFVIINAVLWGLWAVLGGAAGDTAMWPWPLIVSLGWGSGLVAHGLDLRAKSPGQLARIDRDAREQMAALYGVDWEIAANAEDFQRARQAADKRFHQNNELQIHFSIYSMISLLFWFIWATVFGGSIFPFPLIIMGLWGAGLAAHAASVYFDSSRSIAARERAVQQALAGEIAVKKKKRQTAPHTFLTDDGEEYEVIEEEWEKENRLQDEH